MSGDAGSVGPRGLFPPAELPEVPAPGDVPWCDYPASPPAADCLSWLKGEVKKPADCAGCVHRKEEADGR